MFSKTFTVAEDDDTGETGMKPPWIPVSNAGSGTLIPHDMFEHSATARHGASEEEFMAVGAAYRIRGENGFFQNGYGNRQNSDVIGNDVYAILTDLSRSALTRFLAAPRLTYKLKDEEAEFVCQQAARKGIKMALSKWRDEESLADASDGEVIREMLDGGYSSVELQNIVAGWMRIGYMNVRRRFPDTDLYSLAYLYKRIGETVNSVLGNSFPGDKVRVTVDLRRFSFTVRNLARLDDY